MSNIELVINGWYKTRSGNDRIKIKRRLDPNSQETGLVADKRVTEAALYFQGYRFLSYCGETYLPNGAYDVHGEETSEDLVEAIKTAYLIGFHDGASLNEQFRKIVAENPMEALQQYYVGNSRRPLCVLETVDVTPDTLTRQENSFCGINQEGDHWVYFDELGSYPWKLADDEAARWAGWVRPEDAKRINEDEGRLITMDDIRAIMKERTVEAERNRKNDSQMVE